MWVLIAAASVLLILLVLFDAFETILLPRRVTRQFRFARMFFVYSWAPWAAAARLMPSGKRRNTFLSWFGPLSVLVLLCLWAVGLIFGFAFLHWALGTPLSSQPEGAGLRIYSYFSGVTFFTLGYGDLTPTSGPGRLLAVAETGIGFGFFAVVISYLPVLYQAFSRREVTISLLDARAGSPPTAGTLLSRMARYSDAALLDQFLGEWERWAAEVLESHVSFPLLSFYRSQHDNQSWLAALTAILDTSALIIAMEERNDRPQAWLTFAMGRHVVVDLAQVFKTPPVELQADRLPGARFTVLRNHLETLGMKLLDDEIAMRRLVELRAMYEPFVHALSLRFLLPLPPVLLDGEPVDNWQTSAWMRRARGFQHLAPSATADEHDD
jgi:hypothetical protein